MLRVVYIDQDAPTVPSLTVVIKKRFCEFPEFNNLKELVLQRLLILSHGNTSVESGFSVNEELLVKNLSEESLISQRIVADHITFHGGPLNVPITKQMLSEANFARQRYRSALEEQRAKTKEGGNSSLTERPVLLSELKEIDRKRKKIQHRAKEDEIELDKRKKMLKTKLSFVGLFLKLRFCTTFF